VASFHCVGLEPDWLESIDPKLKRVRRIANWLIYASVFLGVALLVQLSVLMVPSWLFYSILAGWILYLVVAIAVATGRDKAYPAALALSIVTLIVSLPQPEHYSIAKAGPTLASLTFIAGSVLQIGVIILVTSSMFLEREGNQASERFQSSDYEPWFDPTDST
jgi:signal transduction histidine kinase